MHVAWIFSSSLLLHQFYRHHHYNNCWSSIIKEYCRTVYWWVGPIKWYTSVSKNRAALRVWVTLIWTRTAAVKPDRRFELNINVDVWCLLSFYVFGLECQCLDDHTQQRWIYFRFYYILLGLPGGWCIPASQLTIGKRKQKRTLIALPHYFLQYSVISVKFSKNYCSSYTGVVVVEAVVSNHQCPQPLELKVVVCTCRFRMDWRCGYDLHGQGLFQRV